MIIGELDKLIEESNRDLKSRGGVGGGLTRKASNTNMSTIAKKSAANEFDDFEREMMEFMAKK
jgi:hypothetical protein